MVTNEADRCPRCRAAPRWCICAGERTIEVPFALEVLMHASEQWRPTSTGHLLARVVAGARRHIYERDAPPAKASVAREGHEMWVLHPRGEPVPRERPGKLQVVVLDGSWRETAGMARVTAGWGRLVRLRDAGPSRYVVRSTPHSGTYATAEAVVQFLQELDEERAAEVLRAQFELHVYAALRTRGSKVAAEEFLQGGSRLREEFPALLEELNRRRTVCAARKPKEEDGQNEKAGGVADS